MIYTRKQFMDVFKEVCPDIRKDDCPMWVIEQHVTYNKKSRYFVEVNSVKDPDNNFWNWCYKNCRGTIICYSSNENTDWWGFSHKPDIFIWLLRWS